MNEQNERQCKACGNYRICEYCAGCRSCGECGCHQTELESLRTKLAAAEKRVAELEIDKNTLGRELVIGADEWQADILRANKAEKRNRQLEAVVDAAKAKLSDYWMKDSPEAAKIVRAAEAILKGGNDVD